MEGRLTLGTNKETAYLEIKRDDRWSTCCCPYTGTVKPDGAHSTVVCGDWCPLFGEPGPADGVEACLHLCHRTLYFDKFEDSRNAMQGQEEEAQEQG